MANNNADLWRYFKNYVTAPYRNNPESASAVAAWSDGLEARRAEGLDLSLCRIEHNAHPSARFTAFCLNEQMFVSTSPLVLTAAHISDLGASPSRMDRYVGAWLHDLGKPDDKYTAFCEQNLASVRSGQKDYVTLHSQILECQHIPYVEAVMKKVSQAFAAAQAIGIPSSGIVSRSLELTSARPRFGNVHRDTRNDNPQYIWGRLVTGILEGTGMGCAIGKNEDITVTLPTNALSSHVYTKYEHEFPGYTEFGLKHWGNGHPVKRVAVYAETNSEPYNPNKPEKSPWNISTLLKAAA